MSAPAAKARSLPARRTTTMLSSWSNFSRAATSCVINALSLELMTQLVAALEKFDQDDNIVVVLLAGNERAFAAGADIGDMATATPLDQLKKNQFARWE